MLTISSLGNSERGRGTCGLVKFQKKEDILSLRLTASPQVCPSHLSLYLWRKVPEPKAANQEGEAGLADLWNLRKEGNGCFFENYSKSASLLFSSALAIVGASPGVSRGK
jgi:hypothetical protein